MHGEQEILKRCRDCGNDKPLSQFPLQRLGRLGRHPLCKICRAAQERRRYARDRAALLEQARNDERRKQRVRRRSLVRKYGLDEHDHRVLFTAQRGCCAICDRRALRLVVDHDHRTGKVRGLLCVTCNFALGELEDDPSRCDAAAAYLRAAL